MPPQFQNYAPNGIYNQMGATAQPTIPAIPTDLADILGIAEKAASAVQALNNRQQQLQPQPPPPMTATLPPSLNHYDPAPVAFPNIQQQSEQPVKITDLTPMIQYSITNLRATGMLDKGEWLYKYCELYIFWHV